MAEQYREAEFSAEDISRWCGLAQPAFRPGSVFYAGSAAAAVVDEFRQAGIAAAGYEPGISVLPAQNAISSGVACDVLILHQDALGGYLETTPQEFYSLFGSPRQVFVILKPGEGEPVLPATSQWLWHMGFGRDFSIELWVADRLLTVAYCPEMRYGDAVAMYEAEAWRMMLLNHKRRYIAHEYLEELARADLYRVRLEVLRSNPVVKLLRGMKHAAGQMAQLPRALLRR